MTPGIEPEELGAFLDGELPPERSAAIRKAVAQDPALAARFVALRRDKVLLAAAYGRAATAPLPQSWLDRIDAAVPADAEPHASEGAPREGARILPFPPPRRRRFTTALMAIAASVVLLLAGVSAWRGVSPGPDAILAQAEEAASGGLHPAQRFTSGGLPDDATRQRLLAQATGLKLRAPDLTRLGWRLASLETFSGAAQLRYLDAAGKPMTVFVRRSLGVPRFDLLHRGRLRICVWQDDVVGAVILADMPAGQMMRVAGAAYADLNL